MLRRDVPADLIGRQRATGERFGRVLKGSTGTTDRGEAVLIAQGLQERWSREFAEARALGSGPILTLSAALHAIGIWRAAEVAAAADFAPSAAAQPNALVAALASTLGATLLPPGSFEFAENGRRAVRLDARSWAEAYFDAHPAASREIDTPADVAMSLHRLEGSREEGGWTGVADFDSRMEAATAAGGAVGHWTPAVREKARPVFARAAHEVEQHLEFRRQRAATILCLAQATADAVGRQEPTPAFVPRTGDRTLKEVIAAFAARQATTSDRVYNHVTRALAEIIGEHRPVRSITREDVREVRSALSKVPTNAAKIYPGMSLHEAATAGAAEGRPTLSPGTLRSYMINLSALMNFALEERWIDANPVTGLLPPKAASVQRRGFTGPELERLFASLAGERAQDAARFWVPALAAFSGARLNELTQLRTEDVKSHDGVDFIDLTLFDSQDGRVEEKKLKNRMSARAIPLHPELVIAGVLRLVERRQGEGEERLFPELRRHGASGSYGHEFSKWFGRHLHKVQLDDPALVFHSFRHGFKDAGSAAGLPDSVLDALGGWAAYGQAGKYGDRNSVARVIENAHHMRRIVLAGGFRLGPQR